MPLGAWAAAALVLIGVWSFRGAGPVDDDFICYRYARNLVEGHGLVYLEGVRAEGFTAPLWVFVQAAGIALGADPVRTTFVLGLLSAAVCVLALGRAWAWRHPGARHAPAAWLVALSPVFAWHGVAGLGTVPLAALLALWLANWEGAVARDRAPRLAAVWLGLACLLRQECALFAVPFALAVAREARVSGRWRGAAVAAGLPLACLAGWTAFRLAHFGRWLPITYGVKKLPVPVDLTYGLAYLAEASRLLAVAPLLMVGAFAAFRVARGGTGNTTGTASASGTDEDPGAARRRAARARLDRTLWTALALHTAYVVWVGGDFVPWARFCVPVFPLLVHVAVPAVRPLRTGRVLLAGLAVAWLSWPQLHTDWLTPGLRERVRGAGWVHDLRQWRALDHRAFEARWRRIGRWLAANVEPGARVATSPIGAIGWEYEGPVLDLLGLTHPHALGLEPDLTVTVKGHHRSATEWVLEQRPEWAVLGNGVLLEGRLEINPWERALVLDPRFQRDYHQVQVLLPGDPEPLQLFVRADVPRPPGVLRLR